MNRARLLVALAGLFLFEGLLFSKTTYRIAAPQDLGQIDALYEAALSSNDGDSLVIIPDVQLRRQALLHDIGVRRIFVACDEQTGEIFSAAKGYVMSDNEKHHLFCNEIRCFQQAAFQFFVPVQPCFAGVWKVPAKSATRHTDLLTFSCTAEEGRYSPVEQSRCSTIARSPSFPHLPNATYSNFPRTCSGDITEFAEEPRLPFSSIPNFMNETCIYWGRALTKRDRRGHHHATLLQLVMLERLKKNILEDVRSKNSLNIVYVSGQVLHGERALSKSPVRAFSEWVYALKRGVSVMLADGSVTPPPEGTFVTLGEADYLTVKPKVEIIEPGHKLRFLPGHIEGRGRMIWCKVDPEWLPSSSASSCSGDDRGNMDGYEEDTSHCSIASCLKIFGCPWWVCRK